MNACGSTLQQHATQENTKREVTPPGDYIYSWINSSDTAAGVKTPKSVISSEICVGGV